MFLFSFSEKKIEPEKKNQQNPLVLHLVKKFNQKKGEAKPFCFSKREIFWYQDLMSPNY